MTGMPNRFSNCRSDEGGSGGGGRPDETDAARGRYPAGIPGQDGDDRGDRVDPGDLLLLDHRPEAPRAEPAVQHQAGPRGQGGQQPDHLGVDVEQREAAVAAVGRRQPVVDGHARGDVRELAVAEQDALGRAGAPARAQEDPPGGRRAVGLLDLACLVRAGRRDHRQVRRKAGAIVAGHRVRPGHVEDPGQRRGGRGRIEGDHDPACGQDADQGRGVSERVWQPDGHEGAGRYPGAVQARGPGAGGALQAGEGQRPCSGGIFEVGGASPASRCRVYPVLDQRYVPF